MGHLGVTERSGTVIRYGLWETILLSHLRLQRRELQQWRVEACPQAEPGFKLTVLHNGLLETQFAKLLTIEQEPATIFSKGLEENISGFAGCRFLSMSKSSHRQ